MSLADMFGYAAAFCTTIAYLPQAIKVYKTRHTKDISIGMFLIMVLGLFLWEAYGLIQNAPPIIAANLVTLVLAGYILVMKIKLDYILPKKKYSKV